MRRSHAVVILFVVVTLGLSGCSLLGPPLEARFEVTPLVVYAGEEARFDASGSLGSGITGYAWTFGDGEEAAGREVTHAYALPGRYDASLDIDNDAGLQARTTREIVVYVRSGTELFREDFGSGSPSLLDWPLDPSWASETDGFVENLPGAHGFVLHVKSGVDRWHRRTTPVRFPPLRLGQRLVFTCAIRTSQNQDAHGFFLFPARAGIDSVQGSYPYFVYSSREGGSMVLVPEGDGVERFLIPFKPAVYLWHTYRFSFSAEGWELSIDDTLMGKGDLPVPVDAGGEWLILLGDESHEEAVDACYDDLRVWVEE